LEETYVLPPTTGPVSPFPFPPVPSSEPLRGAEAEGEGSLTGGTKDGGRLRLKNEMKKVGKLFIEGKKLIIVFLFLVIPFASCVHKKAKSQLQPNTVKAIFKTELFTIRTDSLFPNGLMINIEMYEETNRRLSHSFHFADSGKWGELKSDTIGGELILFHGVIFQLDSFAPSYMNYEKAIYYIKKPLSITILRDNKIDVTFS
jgi:hypothetical protein